MDAQIERNRTELILALRSGRYPQCRFHIIDGGKRCLMCTGFKLFGINYKEVKDDPQQLLADMLGIEMGMYFSSHDPNLFHTGLQGLAMYNDHGKTFPELADILVKDYGFPDVHVFEEKLELELETV